MNSEMQQFVDQLARELNRPVAIDDTQLRLQCYSPHHGQVDQARIDSIMHRAAAPEILAYIESLDLPKAVEPVRIPTNHELETFARVCVPIRHDGVLLGYLWIIDQDNVVTSDELEHATAVAGRIGLLLHNDQLRREVERGHERELLRDLLANDAELRRAAATSIVGSPGANGHRWTVLVARPPTEACPLAGLAPAFDAELMALRNTPGPATVLHLVRSDHVILVAVQPGRRTRHSDVRALANAYHGAVRAALRPVASGAVVGVGDTQTDGADVLLSYEQAAMSCRVAGTVAGIGDIALWSECGVYRTLLGIAPASLGAQRLDPTVRQLLDADKDGVLSNTVEHYLDSGTRVKLTSEQLNLHRTTLYYRIHRVEEITGLDLSNGADRLVLHLGLKLARLASLLPPHS